MTNQTSSLGAELPAAFSQVDGLARTLDQVRHPIGAPPRLDLTSLSNMLSGVVEMLNAFNSEALAAPTVTTRPAMGVAATRCSYAPCEWPNLLGRGQVAQVSKMFNEGWFRDSFRPGEAIEIYAGAGAGARLLATTYLTAAYKFGTVVEGRIGARFKDLRNREYGALWMRDGRLVKDSCFGDWFPAQMQFGLMPSSASPVRVTPHSIRVQLPDFMSPTEFEAEWRKALTHCELHRFVQSDPGLRRCALLGANPMKGVRSTAYQFGKGTEIRPAEELYVLRPVGDADALLVIAERIVLRHVAQRVGRQA